MPALRRRHFFVASVAATTVLADVLTVALAGIPFDSASSYTAYTVSTYLSAAILALMLDALAALVWRARSDPVLPRAPESVAAVALALCGSGLVGEVEGLAGLEQGVRDRRVEGIGRRYWGGEGVGVDGVVRWGVDCEDGEGKR